MTYASTVLADNPIAYWKLGESSGASSIADSSTHGPRSSSQINSVTMGSTALLLGDAGLSMLSSQPDKGWAFAPSADFSFGTGDFSFECWIKSTGATPTSTQVIFAVGTALFGVVSGGFATVSDGVSGQANSTANVCTGSPVHVVVTRTSGSVTCYVNGAASGTTTYANSIGDSSSNGGIGYYLAASGYGFVGNIEHLALYKAALSSTRVMAHYTAGSTASSAATAVSVSPTTASSTVNSPVSFSLAHNGSTTATDTITLSDASGGGTFSPSPLIIPVNGSVTGSYTPGSSGTKNLTFASSLGLTSATATVTVTAGALVAAQNLGDCIAISASTATVTATASGGMGPITYAWYQSPTVGFTPGSGNLVAGQTGATATFNVTPGTDSWVACSISDGTTTVVTFQRLLSSSGLAPLRVGYIGDSTTATGTVQFTENLPSAYAQATGNLVRWAQDYLATRQGNRKVTTVNQGVSGSKTQDWIPGASAGYMATADAAFAAAGLTAGDWIVIRLGVNNAQNGDTASFYSGQLSTIVNHYVAAGFKVQLDYPTYREPGQFLENTSVTFDPSYSALVFTYYPAIAALVNNTTIFKGDVVSARNTATAPTAWLNRSTQYPGGIHPQLDGAVAMGINSAEALMINMGLVGASGTFPTVAQVLNGVTFGPTANLTGNVVLPTAGQVQSGVTFGSAGSLTGTLSSGGGYTLPTASQVLAGISYGLTSAPLTGNVVQPTTGQVQATVNFGPAGALVGTYAGSGTDPFSVVTDGPLTRGQKLDKIAAVLLGVSMGQNTSTPTFTRLDGSSTAVSATLDANGNRTSVTLP